MPAFYKIGEFADKLGVSIQTLRRWDKENKFKPAKITDGGTRLYSDHQLRTFATPELDERYVLAYSKDYSSQLESYLVSKGYCFRLEPNLLDMIDAVEDNKVSRLVFYTKEDISLGSEVLEESTFKLLKQVCDNHETIIEIVKNQ